MKAMKVLTPNAAALKKLGVRTFEVSNYLDSEEAIAEYLSQVLADGDTDELLSALSHVAKASACALRPIGAR